MSCERWRPMLLKAVDDSLDDVSRSDRHGLMAHLEQCAECRLALEEQRTVRVALTYRADAEVPAGFAARVLSEVDLGPSWVDMLRWKTWTYRLVPVATGLLLLGLVTARSVPDPSESVVGLSELAEAWAFGEQGRAPAFTVWGQDDVAGDLLLDAILSADPDEPLAGGDPS